MVLVAGGGGDLGGVVAVAGGLGCITRAQRVAGELAGVKPGAASAFLNDQRDGLVCEPAVGDDLATAHPSERRPAMDLRRGEPRLHRADGAGAGCFGVDDEQSVAAAVLVGHRTCDSDADRRRGRGGP